MNYQKTILLVEHFIVIPFHVAALVFFFLHTHNWPPECFFFSWILVHTWNSNIEINIVHGTKAQHSVFVYTRRFFWGDFNFCVTWQILWKLIWSFDHIFILCCIFRLQFYVFRRYDFWWSISKGKKSISCHQNLNVTDSTYWLRVSIQSIALFSLC